MTEKEKPRIESGCLALGLIMVTFFLAFPIIFFFPQPNYIDSLRPRVGEKLETVVGRLGEPVRVIPNGAPEGDILVWSINTGGHFYRFEVVFVEDVAHGITYSFR